MLSSRAQWLIYIPSFMIFVFGHVLLSNKGDLYQPIAISGAALLFVYYKIGMTSDKRTNNHYHIQFGDLIAGISIKILKSRSKSAMLRPT